MGLDFWLHMWQSEKVMAKMYPPYAESARCVDSGALGEQLVYHELERLPDDWVVIHDCWRYYMDRKARHVNYELDFIVLVPGKGFVVIEVKNWHAAKVEDGVWYFMGRRGEWKTMGNKNSPLHQAYLGCKKLNSELCRVRRFAPWYADREHREGRVEFHGLAVLLNQSPEIMAAAEAVPSDQADMQENGVPLKQLYICGAEELRCNLRAKIEGLFSGAAHYIPITHAHIAEIVRYLLPTFHLKADPESYHRMMEDATAALLPVLSMLEESSGGILVRGCAGTGKTWMAVHEICRLSRKHGRSKRILYLCYNVALAGYIRRLPALAEQVMSGVVEAYTFEELCRRITGACFADWAEETRWYRELRRNGSAVLDDVCRKIAPDQRYDYIFIDECQDFLAAWEGVIQGVRRESTKVYYFSDDHQNLFVKEELPYCPPAPTRVRLTRNLRNTAEIARYSAALLGLGEGMLPLELPGLKVEICRASADAAERGRLVWFWIERLMRGQREEARRRLPEEQQNHWLAARAHQIVVLSPYAPYKKGTSGEEVRSECSLLHVPALTLRSDALGAEALLERWERQEDILMGTTIRSFKGLEADYVILTDVDAPGCDHAQTVNDFYVGCTRARYGLIIIPKSSAGEEYARSVQKAVAGLPPGV